MPSPARWLFVVAVGCLVASLWRPAQPLPSLCGEGAMHPVYLVGHGWHAGLVVERASLSSDLWPEQADFPEAAYLEVGWGDSAYYRTPDPGPGLALRAALHSTPSVLHIVGFRRPVTDYFPTSQIVRIEVSRAGLDSMAAYIHRAYDRDGTGQAVPLGPGLYGESRFYAGREKYHLLHNCNAWTAQVLHAAGCPLPTTRVLTVAALMEQVQRFGEVIQTAR